MKIYLIGFIDPTTAKVIQTAVMFFHHMDEVPNTYPIVVNTKVGVPIDTVPAVLTWIQRPNRTDAIADMDTLLRSGKYDWAVKLMTPQDQSRLTDQARTIGPR